MTNLNKKDNQFTHTIKQQKIKNFIKHFSEIITTKYVDIF